MWNMRKPFFMALRVLGWDDLHSAIVHRDLCDPLGVARSEPKRSYPTYGRLGRLTNHLWAGNTGRNLRLHLERTPKSGRGSGTGTTSRLNFICEQCIWRKEASLSMLAPHLHFHEFQGWTPVSTGAIIACVLRILVMYDPVKRRKYGRYTKEERMFQALVWMFVLLEVGAWSTACVTGGEWIARKVSVLDLLSMLAVLVAAVLLSGQLRKVQDICQLSRDTQRLGALVLWTIGVYIMMTFLPLPPLAYKYMVVTRYIITLQPVAWAINIKPVIDYLRQGESSGSSRDGLLVLLVPWAWLWRWVTDSGNRSGRVACTVAATPGHRLNGIGSSSAMGHLHGTPLAAVMEFPPLRQTFGGYCQKALCSECLSSSWLTCQNSQAWSIELMMATSGAAKTTSTSSTRSSANTSRTTPIPRVTSTVVPRKSSGGSAYAQRTRRLTRTTVRTFSSKGRRRRQHVGGQSAQYVQGHSRVQGTSRKHRVRCIVTSSELPIKWRCPEAFIAEGRR